MVKILSKSGDSLADTYDVLGSIAGIEQLEAGEVSLVHEMGSVIFSERLSTVVRRLVTGAINQSSSFNVTLTNLPDTPTRLLGVAVFADDGNGVRIAECSIFARNRAAQREFPVWVYDGTTIIPSRFLDEGVTADFDLLVGSAPMSMLPSFVGGTGQPHPGQMNDVAMHGLTTAFGAGNVTITAYLYIALAQIGALSSRGLPIPSW